MDADQASAGNSADLKSRLRAAALGPTDIFGLSYIQLCGLSYDVNPADIPGQVADPARVTPWGEGSWRCVWGPALDDEEANLVYVAAYYDAGLPVAAVVVVRGTDMTGDAWGDLKEAFEDLAASYQVQLPWLNDPSVLVADGTLDALTTIESLRPDRAGPGLQDFLAGFLGDPANRKPVLVVTGHSLGGCVTTVLAPWLGFALGQRGVSVPIVPCTFAAPTAGNDAFTRYFAGLFPYAPRYFNTLDAVPLAWADLVGINGIYDDFGLPTPIAVQGLVDAFRAALWAAGATYAQPSCTGELRGSFCIQLGWYDQIGAQHDHNNYIRLMNGQDPTCPSRSRPRTRRWNRDEKEATLGAGAAGSEATQAPPLTG